MEQTQNAVRWHILFEGDVQFVGFRNTARVLARRLGLSGWVRNLDDGRVELEAQGEVSKLRKYLLQLKSQPHLLILKSEISVIPLQPYERGFQVRSGSTDSYRQ